MLPLQIASPAGFSDQISGRSLRCSSFQDEQLQTSADAKDNMPTSRLLHSGTIGSLSEESRPDDHRKNDIDRKRSPDSWGSGRMQPTPTPDFISCGTQAPRAALVGLPTPDYDKTIYEWLHSFVLQIANASHDTEDQSTVLMIALDSRSGLSSLLCAKLQNKDRPICISVLLTVGHDTANHQRFGFLGRSCARGHGHMIFAIAESRLQQIVKHL